MGPIYCKSQSTIKCSVTLLKNGVREIGLKSFSDCGSGTFPIGVIYSFFQCFGHCPVLTILLIMLERGVANSTGNSFRILFGDSPGIPYFGFLAAQIFRQVLSVVTVGAFCRQTLSLVWTQSERFLIFSGGYWLLISAK